MVRPDLFASFRPQHRHKVFISLVVRMLQIKQMCGYLSLVSLPGFVCESEACVWSEVRGLTAQTKHSGCQVPSAALR